MSLIKFTVKPFKINSHTILLLPKDASKKLPSRGMCMVEGKINGLDFQAPLEPDGNGSHYLNITKDLDEKVEKQASNKASIEIESVKDWPEPHIPNDFKNALDSDKRAKSIWESTTPIAHWDWIRWVQGTKNTETRKNRIKVACSKMRGGEKRPCCFNRSMCTDPDVSKSGKLLDQKQVA